MAEIELVIKIPEEDFERCKKKFQMRIGIMGDAIANGAPLPKGHGRLIDADELEECKEIMETCSGESKFVVRTDDIRNAPTIVEADKAESEAKE